MQLESVASPFAEEPLAEVPLTESPLVSVLFQVRLPMSASRLQQSLMSNQLQAELADEYPFAAQQESFNFLVQPGQPPVPQQGPPTWVLQNETQDWVCSVSADSVGLTATSYTSRQDFIDRAARLLTAVEKLAKPPRASRVGVRYLNRVLNPTSSDTDWIQTLASGARGILADVQPAHRKNVVNSLSQVLYQWPSSGKRLQCRWGILPPDAVVDASMPPVAVESWILDIDSFTEGDHPFEGAGLASTIEDLASRAYRFFRWVVTPESLERFSPREP